MRKADNLPPYCVVVKKSRSLNFLDPSGPAWPVTGVLYLYQYSEYTTMRGMTDIILYLYEAYLRYEIITAVGHSDCPEDGSNSFLRNFGTYP